MNSLDVKILENVWLNGGSSVMRVTTPASGPAPEVGQECLLETPGWSQEGLTTALAGLGRQPQEYGARRSGSVEVIHQLLAEHIPSWHPAALLGFITLPVYKIL